MVEGTRQYLDLMRLCSSASTSTRLVSMIDIAAVVDAWTSMRFCASGHRRMLRQVDIDAIVSKVDIARMSAR